MFKLILINALKVLFIVSSCEQVKTYCKVLPNVEVNVEINTNNNNCN